MRAPCILIMIYARSRLQEHDVLFLVTIRSPIKVSTADRKAAMRGKSGKNSKKRSNRAEEGAEFLKKFGVVNVRGCEVYEVGLLLQIPNRSQYLYPDC